MSLILRPDQVKACTTIIDAAGVGRIFGLGHIPAPGHRFTNARFSLNREDLSNTFVHLTNHAVQKKDKRVIPPAVRRRRTANTATAATAAARAARTTRPRRTLSGPFTA